MRLARDLLPGRRFKGCRKRRGDIRHEIAAIGLICLLATASASAIAPASARSERCFLQTGQCVSGRFREFWEQHGRHIVFGFPIASEFQDGRMLQYFERQRFELHPENRPPYDVLLGRLGDEALQRRGIDWWTQPTSPGPVAGCLYFVQTQHNVCNQ